MESSAEEYVPAVLAYNLLAMKVAACILYLAMLGKEKKNQVRIPTNLDVLEHNGLSRILTLLEISK